MNRFFVLGGLLALAVAFTSVRAEDDKLPSIKAIMKATHGKTAFNGKAAAAAKAKNFEEVATIAKEWEKCAEALCKNTPKKGDEESWKKLTGAYAANIKKLSAAAEKKDAKGVNGALGYVGKSCVACHKAHK